MTTAEGPFTRATAARSEETPGGLDGVRVVSLAINLPGPLAASRLSAMGALVTKVEPPTGDPLAHVAPHWYAALAAGQRVVTWDLKTAADQRRLHDLLRDTDVLLTSSRPSALDRIGLADLSTRHPHLLHVEVVGEVGTPERPGHDLTYQAQEGSVDPPHLPTVPVADLLGAERAVSATLLALLSRPRGAGGRVRVGLADAAAVAAQPRRAGLTGPGSPLGGGLAAYALYRAADGWVALAALEPRLWTAATAMLGVGLEATADDVGAVLLTRPAREWAALALERDVPLVEVRERR